MKKLMIIAGEASGDLHGAGVVKELKKIDSNLEIFGVGGDLMKASGMELISHCEDLSVMGFREVITHLPKIFKIEKILKEELIKRKPEKILLIDYPGFNLRFAKFAKEQGVKVLYYISPQIWAWKSKRIKIIKERVDKMFVVFPFEKKIYEKESIPFEFVGHPLVEELKINQTKKDFIKNHNLKSKKILALLPGSRKQEIDQIFPILLETARGLKKQIEIDVLVAVAPHCKIGIYKKHISKNDDVKFIFNQTYEVIKFADAALVTSGTATLETALLETPFALVYKTSWFTYFVGKYFVKINNIGLVNIVAGRTIVPEFIQHNLKASRLVSFVKNLLEEKSYSDLMKTELSSIKELLGSSGASKKVAEGIVSLN